MFSFDENIFIIKYAAIYFIELLNLSVLTTKISLILIKKAIIYFKYPCLSRHFKYIQFIVYIF